MAAKNYDEIRQLIINTLEGRPAGTMIYPEGHQEIDLSILDFANAISSIISTGIAGEAQASTQPIQPSGSNVAYIFQVAPNSTKTFTNFRDSGGNAISVTTNSSQAAVGFLLWNGSYWSAMTVYIAVTSPAFETISSDIIQLLDGTTPVYPRTKAEAVFLDGDVTKTVDKELIRLAQETHSDIVDKTNVFADASSLIDNWHVDGTAITFVSSDGMNGTFTSHTAPGKPTNTRPYFRFQGFEAGKKYRLKMKVVVNSSRASEIGIFYGLTHTESWSTAKLIDVDGNVVVSLDGVIDCIFEAVSGRTYLGFSADSLGIDDSVTISEFAIDSVTGIKDVDEKVEELSEQIQEFSPQILDAKTNLNKVGFVGADNTFVEQRYYNLLLPNHTYKITFTNPNWLVPSNIGSSSFRVVISTFVGTTETRYYYVYANNAVADSVVFAIGDTVPDYFRIGGRAVAETEVVAIFEDITEDSQFDKTRWPKHFTKEDCDFKGRVKSGGINDISAIDYIYLFKVSDLIFLEAGGLPDGFRMNARIYEKLSDAMELATSGSHPFGNGISSPNLGPYKWGNSDYKNGFLVINIRHYPSTSVITDEEIAQIESSLWINFYPLTCQGQVDDIKNEIKELHGIAYNQNDFVPWISTSSGVVSANTLDRVKFFKENFIGNKKISVNISNCLPYVSGLVYGIGVFNTLDGAAANRSVDVKETVVGGWINTNTQDALVNSSGVLSVYFKKSDNTGFTVAEYQAVRNNIIIKVESNSGGDSPVPSENVDGSDSLPIGQFVNNTTKIVSSSYVACVPYIGIRYYFKLPDGIRARIAYGVNQNVTPTDWVDNGGSIKLSDNVAMLVQRIDFCLSNGNDLSVSTISDYVQSGDIEIVYSRIDAIVSQRNYENEKYIKSAVYRLIYQNSSEIMPNSGVPSFPALIHVSDLHGDIKRFENAVQYANILGANAILASGDNVMYVSSDGTGFMKDVITKYPSIPFLNCIGNHEALPANTYDNAYLFNNHISPFVEQGGYESADNVPATMPYYYKDLDPQKLRIITINQYDNACYFGSGLGGRLGQTQVTWLCNTLLSTPAGYGVIIMMHSPEDKVDTPNEFNNWNQTVNWDGRNEDEYGYAVNGLYVNIIRPIKTIVDAFISKTSLSTSYDENTVNGNNGETVTINVDFSRCAAGVEFICYVTGHRHKDNIGYVHTAINRQLILNVCCSNGHYPKSGGLSFAEGTDLPRGDRGVTQDAFNVYGIDRQSGRVKLARVGSNVNFEGIDRKFLLAPYKYANHRVVQVLGSGATTSNTDMFTFTTVESGQNSFNTVITVSSSYTISALTVRMDGVLLVEGTDYTFNSSTGELNIPNVTGDLQINVSTAAVNQG